MFSIPDDATSLSISSCLALFPSFILLRGELGDPSCRVFYAWYCHESELQIPAGISYVSDSSVRSPTTLEYGSR